MTPASRRSRMASSRSAFSDRWCTHGSNLPGPGGSTPDDAPGYDFFRQRVRLNLEAAPNDSVGAFVQVEFRGGWGGSAPGASDPRSGEPAVYPFNRIGDRGLRYTYLFCKASPTQQVTAGILPYSDEFGDTLFSADWDWHVGGVGWLGGGDRARWRLAALNIVEGVGASERGTIAKDGTMVLADYSRRSAPAPDEWTFDWGAHLYGLLIQETLPLGGTKEFWLGPDLALHKGDFALRFFGIVNMGDLGRSSTRMAPWCPGSPKLTRARTPAWRSESRPGSRSGTSISRRRSCTRPAIPTVRWTTASPRRRDSSGRAATGATRISSRPTHRPTSTTPASTSVIEGLV